MGLRYRKSINLGGGFRVNLSKSGIGYSWGVKGYRKTRTSSGKKRTTTSIPGTGISFVQESKKNKKHSGNSNSDKNNQTQNINNNYYDTQEINNSEASLLVSEGLEDMLASANKSLKLWNMGMALLVISAVLGFAYPFMFILTAISAFFLLFLKKNATIDIEYTFDDDQEKEIQNRMQPLLEIIKSNKVWWISQTSKVIDKKYEAGASNTVKRKKCSASQKIPFPFSSNSIGVSFKSGKETILFMPDKLFVIQGSKIGALNYSDVNTSVNEQRFIETEVLPKDAKVIDYTWKYVNKAGGPDKRFQNNKKLPICLYGEMEIYSQMGVNTCIMFSNINIQ